MWKTGLLEAGIKFIIKLRKQRELKTISYLQPEMALRMVFFLILPDVYDIYALNILMQLVKIDFVQSDKQSYIYIKAFVLIRNIFCLYQCVHTWTMILVYNFITSFWFYQITQNHERKLRKRRRQKKNTWRKYRNKLE